RLEFHFLVDRPEAMDALLQALRDRQVARPDDVAVIGLGCGLGDGQQIVELGVDEVAVPLEVVLVDVQPCGRTEEPLEPGDGHHGHDGNLRLRAPGGSQPPVLQPQLDRWGTGTLAHAGPNRPTPHCPVRTRRRPGGRDPTRHVATTAIQGHPVGTYGFVGQPMRRVQPCRSRRRASRSWLSWLIRTRRRRSLSVWPGDFPTGSPESRTRGDGSTSGWSVSPSPQGARTRPP